jgi:hypothetical protein
MYRPASLPGAAYPSEPAGERSGGSGIRTRDGL